MNPSKPPKHSYQSRNLRSILQLFSWAVAWVGTCALMSFGPRLLWNKTSALTLLAVGLNFCVGVGLIVVHKKYLGSLDELQRKVYLDALGITVGVVLIVAVPYAVLDRFNIVHLKGEVSDLLILMTVTFLASFLNGTWRYR
jgi:hypothetical protein